MSSSEEWIKRADAHVMKTYGRYPLVAARGQGCRLWDIDGQSYLDFLAGVAVNNLGHCHPKVVAALRHQAEQLRVSHPMERFYYGADKHNDRSEVPC